MTILFNSEETSEKDELSLINFYILQRFSTHIVRCEKVKTGLTFTMHYNKYVLLNAVSLFKETILHVYVEVKQVQLFHT